MESRQIDCETFSTLDDDREKYSFLCWQELPLPGDTPDPLPVEVIVKSINTIRKFKVDPASLTNSPVAWFLRKSLCRMKRLPFNYGIARVIGSRMVRKYLKFNFNVEIKSQVMTFLVDHLSKIMLIFANDTVCMRSTRARESLTALPTLGGWLCYDLSRGTCHWQIPYDMENMGTDKSEYLTRT